MSARAARPPASRRVRGGAGSPRARMARRAGRARRRRLLVTLSTLLAIALAGGAVWLIGFSPALATQQARVEGLDEVDAETVLAAAAVPIGTPLARVDTGALARRVEQVPFVRAVSVARSWPHTVVLTVRPRTGVLVLRDPSGTLHLVDETGSSFRAVAEPPAQLPVVLGSTETTPGPALRVALEALAAMSATQRSQVSDLRLSAGDRLSFTLGEVEVLWGASGQAARKLAVLDALLTTHPAVVDVSVPDSPVTR